LVKKVIPLSSAASTFDPSSSTHSILATMADNNVLDPSSAVFTKAPPAHPNGTGIQATTVGFIYNRLPALPNGTYESWVNFVDEGGYRLTTDERVSVKRFVKLKRSNPVTVAEGLKFHRLVQAMQFELSSSARDAWDLLLLPPRSYPNFEFCCLFLMIATPAVTDDSVILVFGPLFRDHHITPQWVLNEGESGIAFRLQALGRQTMTARYVHSAPKYWKGMPRDYRELSTFQGVGPKISLVCIAVCFGDEQGAPCDVHMVRIFMAIGWMAVELDVDQSLVKLETERGKKGKTDNQYEVARACMEGWFPKIAWSELNQTWAGLGQLLNKKEERKSCRVRQLAVHAVDR
jgi:endonuclease III